MNPIPRLDTEALLKAALFRLPHPTLDAVRAAHPALGAMSLDHLGLRLVRLLDRREAVSLK